MIQVGQQFNNWKVIEIVDNKNCLCECQCEKHTRQIVPIYNLVNGRSKSCGCTRYTNKKKDLKGQQFGDWTVVKMLPNRKALCRCVCGEEKELYHSNLTRTGGSYKCQHVGIKGQRFGNWLVLEELGGGKVLCQCQCENKTTKELYKSAVISGETKSCGCMKSTYLAEKATDITGEHFGSWEVLRCTDFHAQKYLCRCSCGTEKEVYKAALVHGRTKSCGCRKSEYQKSTMQLLYSETNSARVNNPRQQWQIETLNNKKLMLDYIMSITYKPTVKQLSELLNVHVTTLLPKVHEYHLENYVDIQPMVSATKLELRGYIKSIYAGKVIYNNKSVISPYELDIYLPEKKIAIEFNGNYWHSTKHKDKKYHQEKTIACAKQGIRLIHIFEYEWKNNKEKIQMFLHDNLVDRLNTIYARNCSVIELDSSIIKEFCNRYHLQGHAVSSVNLALTCEEGIVEIMTFGKPRFDNDSEYELIRLCNKANTKVVGGAQKLFQYFVEKYNPSTVSTYSDISKFTGNIYTKLRFRVTEFTQPTYVWVDTNTNHVLSRYQTQKDKLIENKWGTADQTENEIMENNGYLKIYNSGNLKLVWNNNERK